MHTPFFAGPGFEFQNLLNWQGLQPFLGINLSYNEDLVRVFYTNAKSTPAGHIAIEICGKMIHIKEIDWMTIAHLQYDGLKLTPGTIPEELNFDRGLALSSMIREDVEGENLKNVSSLKNVEGGQPEEANPTQRELLNQILSDIQNMNTRMDRIEVTLADIRRHQDH